MQKKEYKKPRVEVWDLKDNLSLLTSMSVNGGIDDFVDGSDFGGYGFESDPIDDEFEIDDFH